MRPTYSKKRGTNSHWVSAKRRSGRKPKMVGESYKQTFGKRETPGVLHERAEGRWKWAFNTSEEVGE